MDWSEDWNGLCQRCQLRLAAEKREIGYQSVRSLGHTPKLAKCHEMGQVDLAETNENERGYESGNKNENGKGRQDHENCGKDGRFRK